MFNTTYHLILSRFDEGKEIRRVCSKMTWKSNAKCCGDVAAALWKRLDNVGERRCHKRRKPTSGQLSFSTVLQYCDNVNNGVVNVAVPVGDEGYQNILKLSCRLLAFTSY